MTDFLGVDIAGIVAETFTGIVNVGNLEKITPGARTAGSLTAGTNPKSVSHSFEGFKEFREVRRKEQLGADIALVITVFLDTIKPPAKVAVGDRITIEGLTVDVTEILVEDPAGATVECIGE